MDGERGGVMEFIQKFKELRRASAILYLKKKLFISYSLNLEKRLTIFYMIYKNRDNLETYCLNQPIGEYQRYIQDISLVETFYRSCYIRA